MIYIINNIDNTITTESWIDIIPSTIIIYFDDIEIGEFDNLSLTPTYIKFEISSELLNSLKLENMEYNMKIYKDYVLFKTELISINSNNILNIVSPIKSTIIKMKEK